MNEKNAPLAVIRRLPRYYRHLGELLKNDIYRISSRELSERMNVTASQIRQDLNFFGGFGQQGYGYNVEYLYNEIGTILGLNCKNNTIIIGAGKLGQALAKYPTFKKRGFILVGIFDVDPEVIGTEIAGVEVAHIDTLEDFMAANKVRIAILTLPKDATHDVALRLADCGIKGILNFSYVDLDIPQDIAVENVHLSDSMMTLSYKIASRERDKEQ